MTSRPLTRLCLALACIAAPATAANLQMVPIRLGLSGDAPATILTAINPGNEDSVYQLTVAEWSQAPDGSDILKPTRDILANPGIFNVRAANQQIIRLGLRTNPTGVERSYRVIVQELPQPDRQTKGMTTLLRISIPLFIPTASPSTAMQWVLRPGPEGATLTARNSGNVHVQIIGVTITGGAATPPLARTSTYVLPGSTRDIRVGGGKPIVAGTTYHVRIDTDQGVMNADLRAESATMAAAG